MGTTFTCGTCGAGFELPQEVLGRYPGWKPKVCRACRGGPPRARAGAAPPGGGLGPDHGLFTDGSSAPNPGPGGWAVAWVEHGTLVREASGDHPDTTNNRMELTALIEALKLLPEDAEATVHSDSDLCVKTITQWADGWARAGWKRKTGPIANLDLVQELHALAKARPRVTLAWIPAHSGWRWNEHVDELAGRARAEGEARRRAAR